MAPEFPESYYLLAQVNLTRDENLNAAVRQLKLAQELAPGRHRYAFLLAQAHLRRGEPDEARSLLQPLARAATESHLRVEARKLMENLLK